MYKDLLKHISEAPDDHNMFKEVPHFKLIRSIYKYYGMLPVTPNTMLVEAATTLRDSYKASVDKYNTIKSNHQQKLNELLKADNAEFAKEVLDLEYKIVELTPVIKELASMHNKHKDIVRRTSVKGGSLTLTGKDTSFYTKLDSVIRYGRAIQLLVANNEDLNFIEEVDFKNRGEVVKYLEEIGIGNIGQHIDTIISISRKYAENLFNLANKEEGYKQALIEKNEGKEIDVDAVIDIYSKGFKNYKNHFGITSSENVKELMENTSGLYNMLVITSQMGIIPTENGANTEFIEALVSSTLEDNKLKIEAALATVLSDKYLDLVFAERLSGLSPEDVKKSVDEQILNKVVYTLAVGGFMLFDITNYLFVINTTKRLYIG